MHERDILLAALDKVRPEDREAYLTQACGADVELRSRVDALLRASEVQDSFLEHPAVDTEVLSRETDGIRREDAEHEEVSLDFLQPTDDPEAFGRLGQYTITEVIGRGGMGVVLKARDTKLNRVIAIKVLAPELASNPTARKRFQREARAAAAVVHQHIVTIHAVDEDRLPYLVMECIDGQSLKEKIDREGHLRLVEILRIGQQVASGLAAAHAHGLMHRDVKPANILLENGVERVRITDFGLARAVDDVGMTRTGEIAGTPQYMSPEQAQGLPMDGRSDLFSLGCVLYAMCSGRPPFRAETAFATARRVCEDTPRPIREVNPEIPVWLVTIIDRLLAKQPDERFQTAAEVTSLLGQRLAELQHPAPPAAQLATASNSAICNPQSAIAKHTWIIAAAAAIVGLLIAVSLTEATGVTQFAPTVMRIVTGKGTLLVEVNDPAVKVTVEGDGGLVITGAGLHEVHLKPGKYHLKADKNGKLVPLDQELVTITRGDKEVVRVRLENPAASLPKPGSRAFVLVGGKGIAERKFDTLAKAVESTNDGDTIEIRGNGPFATEPIKIGHALTIRAGEGFRPVVSLSAEGLRRHAPILVSESSLVLEGLEFQRLAPDWKEGDPFRFGLKAEKALHIANCRFLMQGTETCLGTNAAVCELRNSEFLCPSWSSSLNSADLQPGERLVVENCLLTAGCELVYLHQVPNPARVRFARNTFRAGPLWFYLQRENLEDVARDGKVLEVEASDNLFDGGFVVRFEQYQRSRVLPVTEAEKTLVVLLGWKGERNLFSTGEPLVRLVVQTGDQEPANPVKNLAAWRTFWGTPEVNSTEGRVKYQGGDLLARLRATPEKLTPEDFRLRPDSPGCRAGKDGKDLGADVDLVGPGAAYERWKKTPEYQTWLRDSGQLRAEAPIAERGAFVRLGGNGVAERKFDTLAEAVQSTSAGDTIEIRGNGPFVVQPVNLGKTALTIRAGADFRPVIKLHPEWAEQNVHLLETRAALVLEGLELHRVRPGYDEKSHHHVVGSTGAPVRAANCRFVLNPIAFAVQAKNSPVLDLRNCEFLLGTVGFPVVWTAPARGRCRMLNCLTTGYFGLRLDSGSFPPKPASVVLAGNTLVAREAPVLLFLDPTLEPPGGGAPGGFSIEASTNVFDGGNVCLNSYYVHPGDPPPTEAVFLRRSISWKGDRNQFSLGSGFTAWSYPGTSGDGIKDLTEWNRFWRQDDSGCLSGKVRYQGGDILSRADKTPEQLTPEDFRLRPDSAGYKAGKDGKDLGAEVDLVGPGPAYERWKNTPEYQQWLEETRQVKE